jgi:WD40 repeat protein
MQAELNLFLAGRSLRRTRNTERHLARLKRFAAGACLFVALAAVALWFATRETRLARERAREADDRARTEASLRQRAEAAEHASRQQLYTALLEQARATVRSGELGQRVRALDALRRAAAIRNTPELRREAFTALALPDLRFERGLPYGAEYTLRVPDPSFERIALCRGRGPVEIRSASDERLLATLPASTNGPAHHAEWSADGRFLAVKRDYSGGGARADWEIWEVKNQRRVLLLQDLSVSAFSFHPRRHQLMAGRLGGDTTLRSLDGGSELASFRLSGEPIRLRFAPEGERFAAVCQGRNAQIVTVHDATSGRPLASHTFTDFVGTMEWHPGGRWIAVPDHSGAVHAMDAQTGETRVLGRHKAQAVAVVFSPDGAYLISGGWERELICWDVAAMRRAFWMGLDSYVAQFSADGRACAVVTRSGVQFHAFERMTGHREFAEDLGPRVRHAAFSPDGRWLAASGEKRMGVWDLAGGGPGALDDDAYSAHLHFTPDGGELFGSRGTAGASDCRRWRLSPATNETARPSLLPLPFHKPEGFTSLGLRSNSVVITGSKGSQLLAPDELGAGIDRWMRTSAGINGVSPDERWLAVFRAFTPSLHVYRLPDIEHVATVKHRANIADVEFSPRGDEVAICSTDAVEFWSTTTWQPKRLLTNFTRVLFTPDAQSFWLTKDLRTAGLYDAQTLEPRLLLPNGTRPLALSPDGRHLAVSVDARRLQVWDLVEVRKQLLDLGLEWAEAR